MTSTTSSHKELFTNIENPWQLVYKSDWSFVQIKVAYKITLGKMLHNEATSPEDVEVPFLKSQHVQWDKVILQDLPTMWASPWEIKILSVRNGDLLVCEGGDVGRAGIIDGIPPNNCIIQNALHVVRSKDNNSTHFLRYLLQHASSLGWFDVLCNRSTIAHFTVEKFNQMWVWIPSPQTQQKIADYLDRETEKIDALVAAKKRLLKLLAEKRRSMITHAVTRGLRDDVPMKDSGVEWLGEIPVDWEVERVKFLILSIEGGFSPQCYSFPPNEGEWGVLKSGCVNGGVFNPQETKTLPEDIIPIIEFEVFQGDILMSRASGSVQLIGSVALVKEQPKARLLLSDKTFRLALKSHIIDPDFFVAVMGSSIVRQQIHQVISGAEGLANNIAQSDIRELIISLPPLSEQQEIINILNQQIKKIDDLSNISVKTINLLQERRTSLTSAAVTGQLRIAD
jgi:type I restriction enzyme, S subunit